MGSEQAGHVIDVTSIVGTALPEMVRGWGNVRILLVADAAPRPNKGGLAAGVLRRVRDYVHAHLADPIRLQDLARVAGLSECHFCRAFKQSTGIAPRRFLMLQRVERASELIRGTDRLIAEIALEVGFADQSHFTRSFVAATGLPPRAFRQEYR